MEIKISINGYKTEATVSSEKHASGQMAESSDAGAASATLDNPMVASEDSEFSGTALNIGAPPESLFRNVATSHSGNGHGDQKEKEEEDAGAGPEM